MTRFNTLILLLLITAGLLSCGKTRESEQSGESLADKAAPYDQFSFQRSFPDRDFDWRGWRNSMVRLRRDHDKKLLSGLSPDNNSADWTIQGPGNVGGRVNTIAVSPADENTILAGFSGGGIFKSTDGGDTWKPVFDNNLELAVGDIEYDPQNANIVYAGTGDPNMPSIVYNGNGLYKSTDGGESWQYSGLDQAGIVAKVVIDPANSQNLYVATMGNPYVRDNNRGVYKSTDGGVTWTQSLFVSNQAGASDLVISLQNPLVLYASFWDRIRNNQESVIYGPHARVYKSVDGGITWTQLGGGLPSGILGRTGLAISKQNPDKVYAVFMDSLSTPEGLYKTLDGGTTWTPVNVVALEDACGDFGWYFAKIRLNPTNDEDIYFLAIILWRKAPGNTGWQSAANSHADCHDLQFTPGGKRYLGSDGGVYRNTPGQQAWYKSNNLPTTQFYHTNFNLHEPDFYFAGAQDNGIRRGNKAVFNGWSSVFSADGFRCMFHPNDPNTFWVETQNGEIHKTIDGGATWAYGEPCLGTTDRCNWDLPYLLSKHATTRMFAGTYRVYFSDNGGGWGPISPDLTDGNIYGSRFHTISTVDESPVLAEKLLAGTTDGNVWRREPTGNWINISAGLPDRYVTSVIGSPTLANRIFVTHSGFRDNEYIPHIHRSENNGQNWLDISGNLPNVPVNDLFVLPGHADSILFAATDAGVYISLKGGNQWQRLGSNMPFIPVFDLERNPVKNQLMAATYARGLWTFPLDSIFNLPPAATVAVTGTVKTETGAGISDVRVCTQPQQFTDTNGAFSLMSDAACLSSALTPFLNSDPLNGVSTFDLVLINKHILGIEALSSPYKMVAADANNSRSITTFDIVALRKLILGIDTAFANTDSWRFIPASYVFPNPANPFAEVFPESTAVNLQSGQPQVLNFIGLKVGDVNSNAIPSAIPQTQQRYGADWPIALTDQAFEAGESVTSEFTAEWHETVGAQFTIRFDPEVMDLVRLEPIARGLNSDNFGIRPGGGDCFTACFENGKASASGVGNQVLFRVVFKTKKRAQLSACLWLADAPTPGAAFRSDGSADRPVFEWNKTIPAEALNFSLAPNPVGAAGARLIGPDNSGAAVDVTIFDNSGRAVFQRQTFDAFSSVPASAFKQKGVYWYVIRQGRRESRGKLLFTGE